MKPASPLSASIIVDNYNYGNFLATCIDSCLQQSVGSQVVVVDDASTDHSRAVIEFYGDRITAIFHETNRGQAEAFNTGFAHASGDVVILLDADDIAAPHRVERLATAFRDPELDWVRHDMTEIDEEGRLLRHAKYGLSGTDDPRQAAVRYGRVAGSSSGLAFRRTFLDEIGRIPETYRSSADWYLLIAASLGGTGATIGEPLTLRRMHSGQLTHQKRNPGYAVELLAQLGDIARDAQDLARRFGTAPEVAEARTWWQRKAEFGILKLRHPGRAFIRPWFELCWSIVRSALPVRRKVPELARCLILGVVPTRYTASVWWKLHWGRPLSPTMRLLERLLNRVGSSA